MDNMLDDNRVYYSPGDLVTVRHDIPNKPIMMVKEKVTSTLVSKDAPSVTAFMGIRCRWFDKEQRLCEATFSTKDLMKL